MLTIQMSSRGQVVIPKQVRETYGWEEKTKLAIEPREGGVLITPVKTKKRHISELLGSLPRPKKRLSTEELCAPVTDYSTRL